MRRQTLLKYTPRELIERLIRLARASGDNEIEINNVAGLIEDKLLSPHH